MCEYNNKCINRVLLFNFILQNNSKIAVLTFMDVDGAFILVDLSASCC